MEQGFFSQGTFESLSLRIHNIFAVQVFQVTIVAYTLRFGLYKTEVIFLAYSYKWDRYWNGLKKFK